MKIKDISVHLVGTSWRNFIIVKVTADNGVVGYGESTLMDFGKTIEAAVMDYRPHLLGKEIDVPAITNFLYWQFYWHGGPILMSATSGIEQALWDILGKSNDMPIYQMLGGKSVDRVRAYANGFLGGGSSPEECAALARGVVKLGFTAMKFDPFGGSGPRITPDELKVCLGRIEAIRNEVGSNVDLLVEAHGRFDVETAIRVSQEIATYGPFWLEEPIREDNIRAMAEVRSRSPVTIASGERLVTRNVFSDFLAARAAGVIQPDVCHMGGISALTDVAAMAEPYYVAVAPHNPNGPVATAATLNTMVHIRNGLIMEFWIDAEKIRRDLVRGNYFDLREGYLYPSTKPGLGIEIDESAFTKYPYKTVRVDIFDTNYKWDDVKL